MKIEYNGYSIEVTSKLKEGLWAADIWIWTLNQNATPLSDWAEVTSYSSPEEAEKIGLLLAKERSLIHIFCARCKSRKGAERPKTFSPGRQPAGTKP